MSRLTKSPPQGNGLKDRINNRKGSPKGDNIETLTRRQLVSRAKGGKLQDYGVTGISKSEDIRAALRQRAAEKEEVVAASKARKSRIQRAEDESMNKIRTFVEDLATRIENGESGILKKSNVDDTTPLMLACQVGDLDIIKIFVEEGQDVNASNMFDITPIFIAAEKGFTDVVEYLLEKGADPTLTNVMGKNALDAALDKGHADIVTLLEKNGAGPASEVGRHKFRHKLNLVF